MLGGVAMIRASTLGRASVKLSKARIPGNARCARPRGLRSLVDSDDLIDVDNLVKNS